VNARDTARCSLDRDTTRKNMHTITPDALACPDCEAAAEIEIVDRFPKRTS
jgi:hypothetical protein